MRVKIFSPFNECHSHAASSSTSSLIFLFRPKVLPFAEDVRHALAVSIQTCLTWPSSLFSQPHFQGLSSPPPVSSTKQAEKRDPGNEAVFFSPWAGFKIGLVMIVENRRRSMMLTSEAHLLKKTSSSFQNVTKFELVQNNWM